MMTIAHADRVTIAAEMTIAEVARETDLSIHTLRYYERAGLLIPVERNGLGHRRYSAKDIEWIGVCTKLRATGMPISQIRRYAELVREGPGNEAERLALLEAHGEVVRGRLIEIRRNLELINHKIGVYRERLAGGADDRSRAW